MRSKPILLIVFIIVGLGQLYVPASMILERNDILKTGKEFRFKTAPIDPSDPFRGKYVWLNFDNDAIEVTDTTWNSGETVFAVMTEDSSGMAIIKSIHRQKPEGIDHYLKTTVRYVSYNPLKVHLDYPFDRFYMEESKAFPAEEVYIDASRDTASVTYALIIIKNGDAVLKDVHIDGASIREIVKQTQEGHQDED
jgi:uncharacterized membrane-anchored protein